MGFWVYLLRCHDGSYYTGHTDNLEQRIAQHVSGAFVGCYTFQRRPVELVFAQEVATREEALSAERRVKGWSRLKKEAMIRGDWAEVSRLGRSSFDAAGQASSGRTGIELGARFLGWDVHPSTRPARQAQDERGR